MSGIGSGYLSGNMLIPFPFEDGQFLAWDKDALEMQEALQRCFVDAAVHLTSSGVADDSWPSIGGIAIGDGSLSFTLAAGGSSVSLSVSSSDKFPIISGSAPFGYYTVVLSTEGIDGFRGICADKSISPPASGTSSTTGRDGVFWLRLCQKCITVRPVGLTSLQVYDGQVSNGHLLENGPHFILKGDIAVMPGNNMQLSEPDGTEEVNGFGLNAIPGAGLGAMPCVCAESTGGNSAIAGPDGHARMFNDTCYDLEPIGPLYIDEDTGQVTRDLKIHVKCRACCTCDMYADIVARLAELAGQLEELEGGRQWNEGSIRWSKEKIDSLRDQYESAVNKFNERIQAPVLPEDVILSLTGVPIGRNLSPKISNSAVSGQMSRCAFSATVTNNSCFAIVVKVAALSGTDTIAEASASWSDEDGAPLTQSGDSASSVVGRQFAIYPGRSLAITFVSKKKARVSTVSTGGFKGEILVDLSYANQDGEMVDLGSLSKSVEV